MANRILKDWTESERVNGLSANAEVFFTRLIMKADDYGSFHGNPKLLKANLFPLRLDAVRDADVSRWTTECEKAGLILVYTAFDKQYLRIINFGQRLRNMRNKFPDPDNSQQNAATRSEKPPEVEEKKKQKIEVEDEGESGKTPPTLTEDEINFEAFNGWIKKNADQVSRLSSPFTLNEFMQLKKEFTGAQICEILQQMQNKKDLLKKYTSAYLTALNWLKRNNNGKTTGKNIESIAKTGSFGKL